MSSVYLAYEVCIKGNDRAVVISASSSDKITSSLGKYSKELVHVIENTSPSDLFSRLKEEIKRDLPQLLPNRKAVRIDKPDFRQIRFELNKESEAQLSNLYRKIISSYTANHDRK